MNVPILLTVILGAHCAFGQMSTQQKLTDFQSLAAVYAKRYAPYDWKKQIFGVDLFQIQPFLDRATATRNDLDFYQVEIDYVQSLHDGHDFLSLPSNFSARLGFTADLYDGKALIDSINRALLPTGSFLPQLGDEVVSIDGVNASDFISQYLRYAYAGNPRSQTRMAAGFLAVRAGSRIPPANQLANAATVTIRRRTTGNLETYTLNWVTTGVPFTQEGPVATPASVSPKYAPAGVPASGVGREPFTQDDDVPGLPLLIPGHGMDEEQLRAQLPDYQQPALSLNIGYSDTGVLNSGGFGPIFALPAGFKLRLGSKAGDEFFSGTFPAGNYLIGFIRIPSFSPTSFANGRNQFQSEIAFFNANTDGLVVDIMRNPGGILYYGTDLARRIIPHDLAAVGFQYRATRDVVNEFSSSYELASSLNAPQVAIDGYKAFLDEALRAYNDNRGITMPLPSEAILLTPTPPTPSLNIPVLADDSGNPIGYTKPILLLTDEFSVSTADEFAALLQDNHAATLFGWRTGGWGGNNTSYSAGTYSESTAGLTRAIMVRPQTITTPDFPPTQYVENVGVRPDIEYDYMTTDNLVNSGRPFVAAFSKAISDLVVAGQNQ